MLNAWHALWTPAVAGVNGRKIKIPVAPAETGDQSEELS